MGASSLNKLIKSGIKMEIKSFKQIVEEGSKNEKRLARMKTFTERFKNSKLFVCDEDYAAKTVILGCADRFDFSSLSGEYVAAGDYVRLSFILDCNQGASVDVKTAFDNIGKMYKNVGAVSAKFAKEFGIDRSNYSFNFSAGDRTMQVVVKFYCVMEEYID